jgi:hypothetical protein
MLASSSTLTNNKNRREVHMVRYFLFVFAILGSAATAIAAISPDTGLARKNITVIEKNQFWHIIDETTVDECDVEDCSEE